MLKKYIKNLKNVFKFFTIKKIILNFNKCFLNYLEAKLLSIKMFIFDVIIANNKLKIIILLKFL